MHTQTNLRLRYTLNKIELGVLSNARMQKKKKKKKGKKKNLNESACTGLYTLPPSPQPQR